MKNLSLIMLLSSLLLSSVVFAKNADIALNKITGENFILEKENNPKGIVIIKKDNDVNFHQEIILSDLADENNLFEIKLGKDKGNTLYYLVQNNDLWYLNSFKRVGNKWEKNSVLNGLTGNGNAFSKVKNLETHKGNILFLDIIENGQAKVVIIEDNNSKLEIKEKVTQEIIRQRVLELTQRNQISSYIDVSNTNSNNEEVVNLDEDQTEYDSGNGAGFAAGAISGLGIAYRRHFANKWGIQVTGIALGDPSNFLANIGVNVMRTLSKKDRTRFYVVMGAALYYSGSNNVYYSEECQDWETNCTTDPNAPSDWEHDPFINIGVGLGIEWNWIDSAYLSFELPVHLLYDGPNDWQVLYIPSVSLIYYF